MINVFMSFFIIAIIIVYDGLIRAYFYYSAFEMVMMDLFYFYLDEWVLMFQNE